MDTTERLKGFICDLKNVPEVGKDQRLVHDGFLDSFEILQVAQYIEETFRVRFEDEAFNPEVFDTVVSLASHVEKSAAVGTSR